MKLQGKNFACNLPHEFHVVTSINHIVFSDADDTLQENLDETNLFVNKLWLICLPFFLSLIIFRLLKEN